MALGEHTDQFAFGGTGMVGRQHWRSGLGTDPTGELRIGQRLVGVAPAFQTSLVELASALEADRGLPIADGLSVVALDAVPIEDRLDQPRKAEAVRLVMVTKPPEPDRDTSTGAAPSPQPAP